MTSKAAKRRNRKKARTRAKVSVGGVGSQKAVTPVPESRQRVSGDNRPTPERMARGMWAKPQGTAKSQQPTVDLACDMVGILHQSGQITDSQEQAARTWQELRAAYIAEFPDIAGFKSCLHGSVPGYDDGDGDPEIMRAYRSLEAKLSMSHRRMLLWTCDMSNRPTNIGCLRQALDLVAGA